MAKNVKGFAARLLKDKPKTLGRTCWFHDLTKDVQSELLEVRKDWHAGKYPGCSRSQLFKRCSDELGLSIGNSAFDTWLAKKA